MCLSRKSVRAYDKDHPLDSQELSELNELIHNREEMTGPFGSHVHIELIQTKDAVNKKLGTYGFISGATSFFCVFTSKETNMLDVGVVFERVVLECTRRGLGTCWMAGTFSARDFLSVTHPPEGHTLTIVSPVGHPLEPMSGVGALMKGFAGRRKPFDTLIIRGLDPHADNAALTPDELRGLLLSFCFLMYSFNLSNVLSFFIYIYICMNSLFVCNSTHWTNT